MSSDMPALYGPEYQALRESVSALAQKKIAPFAQDVDDALALAALLGSKEVDLIGITTVYGDVRLRSAIVSFVANSRAAIVFAKSSFAQKS